MPGAAKVLVTGASGYIGSHVVQQLLAEGHMVRGTVRSLKNVESYQHLNSVCPEALSNLELVEAELFKEETWLPATEGMDYVIHTACPYPSSPPEGAAGEELVKTAVEGALNVLNACVKVTSVRRVVLTSCATAVHWGTTSTDKMFTEEDWTDLTKADFNCKAKSLAEKAAWDFIKNIPDNRELELAVINPSVTLGPTLHHTPGTSTELLQKLLDRLIPGVPKMNFPIVDVRDVAQAHVRAMTSPNAAGHRHIVHCGNMWMSEIANLLHAVLKPQGYNIPTTVAPNLVLKMVGAVDASVRIILPYLGVVHKYTNNRMRQDLGIEPRNVRDTIIDMAHALIQNGFVHKTPSYAGPGGEAERDSYLNMKL
ncbi:uncharacterized protein [Littorina saxatilis]|uniref:uncharacterized protein isoform X2 n=1 Tax=Littorina saxatilis TaxID=31220 RepID=UPI0038B5D4F9